MDPLALAGAQFLLAMLSGAFVAVLAQRLAFRDAARVEQRRNQERDNMLRRALIGEVRENMARLGGPEPARPPSVAIGRIAWDAARALALPVDAFYALARAYEAGETVTRALELVNQRAIFPPLLRSREAEVTAHEQARAILRRDAGVAFTEFRKALEELGEPVMQIGRPLVLDERFENELGRDHVRRRDE